jgi:glycosyltransferase involved in cell wall biosynthesis
MSRNIRFTIVVSHPIQYYVPFYRALAHEPGIDLHAIYASKIGVEKMLDPDMGVEMAWRTDLLGGYSHEFLPEASAIRDSGFRSVDNPSVWSALDRGRPDIVLLHGYHQLTSLRALAWCAKRKVPALMISDSSLHIGTPAWARPLKDVIIPNIFRKFRAFLSIGDANETYLKTFGAKPEQIFRTPLMLDEGFWATRGRRAEVRKLWRAKLGLEDADLAILFTGKMIPRKRPLDLLDAIERISAGERLHRRPHLLFAGNGILLDELKRTAAARQLSASFLGFVNVDELPGLYCAADVLAHPAEIETYGVVVLEAAVLGLPLVLSHRVGAIGPTSIARPHENALVYECGDVSALASAIRRFAQEPQTLSQFSAASLALSADHDGRTSVAGALAAVEYCVGKMHGSGEWVTEATL